MNGFRKFRRIRFLLLILLGAAAGSLAGLAWHPGAARAPAPAESPSQRPRLQHIVGMFEQILTRPPPRIEQPIPASLEPLDPTDPVVAVTAESKTEEVAEIREMVEQIEAEVDRMHRILGPANAPAPPPEGQFFEQQTDQIEALAGRLAKEPDPPPGQQGTPTAKAHVGWTLRRVYATFGIPDSVWNSEDKMEWTYRTKEKQLRFTFIQGRVTRLHH